MNSIWLATIAALALLMVVAVSGPRIAQVLAVPQGMLWPLCVISAATLLWNLLGSLLVAMERFPALNFWLIANALLTLAVILACAVAAATPTQFCMGTALSALLTTVGLSVFIARRQGGSLAFSTALAGAGLGYSFRAYLTLLLNSYVQRSGAALVAVRAAPVQLGEYSIASQIFDVLLILPASVSMVLYPALVRQEGDSWPQVKRMLRVTMATMVVLCAGAAVTAPWLIPLVFGGRFAATPRLLWCLIPAVLAYSVTSVLSQYLVARRYPTSLILAWGIGLAAVVSVGPGMTRWLGATGAALAQSLSAVLVCAIVLGITWRHVTNLKESHR